MLLRSLSLLCTMFSFAAGVSGSEAASPVESDPGLLFLTTREAHRIREAIRDGDPEFVRVGERLRGLADASMNAGPWSVTYTLSPVASGNPHDYYSEGPYWWPDPKNPKAPYIRRDGEVNPEHFTAHRHALGEMSEAVLALGMAAYFLDDERSARRAAEVIRVWFIDEATRMNPHLEYGQAIFGRTKGRGIGIIDTRRLTYCVQGCAFLRETPYWNAAEQKAFADWLAAYLEWLTHSRKGLDEKKNGNNHSTWWAAQAAVYAGYLDDHETEQMVWDFYRSFLVPHQIRPNGSCPLEEARTKSLSYSAMNLDGFAQICHLARNRGVDLWHFRTDDGRGVERALAYLMPYVERPEFWSKKQISGYHAQRRSLMVLAGIGLNKPEYIEIYRSLPTAEGPFGVLVDMLAIQIAE